MEKRNSKSRWLVFVVLVLVITTAVFCIVLPRKNKIKAPRSENNTEADITDSQNIKATTTDNSDNKGQDQTQTSVPVDNNPSSTDPYYFYDLGNYNFSKNNYQEATSYYNKAIALNSVNPQFYIKKSQVQVALKQKQNAIDTINQGLAKVPNDESLLSQLDIIQNATK